MPFNLREMLGNIAVLRELGREGGVVSRERAPLPRQVIQGAPQQTRNDWTEEDAKFVVSSYTDLITDERTGEAQRELFKTQLREIVRNQDDALKLAIQPLLKWGPADPIVENMERYDKMHKPPTAPMGADGTLLERKPETRKTWAEYDIVKAEHELQRSLFEGSQRGTPKEASAMKFPVLFATDESGVYAYRAPLTKDVRFVNLAKDIDPNVLQRSIELGWGLPLIGQFGSARLGEPRQVTTTDGIEEVENQLNVVSGQPELKRRYLGEKPSGKVPLLPASMKNALSHINLDSDPKTAGVDYAEIEQFKTVLKTQIDPGEIQVDQTGQVTGFAKGSPIEIKWRGFQKRYIDKWGFAPVAYWKSKDGQLQTDSWSLASPSTWLGHSFRMEGGFLDAVPATGFGLIWTSPEEALELLYDQRTGTWRDPYTGQEMTQFRGMRPGDALPEGLGEQMGLVQTKEPEKKEAVVPEKKKGKRIPRDIRVILGLPTEKGIDLEGSQPLMERRDWSAFEEGY